MIFFLQLLLNSLVSASIYSLLAIGFGIVYRSLRFFYIAFGAIYLISSFSVYLMLEIPLFIAVTIGILCTVIIGLASDRIIYLPLERIGIGSGGLLIASLGVYIIMVNCIALIWGNELKLLSKGVEPSLSLGSIIITRIQLIQFILGWGLVILFWLLIRKNIMMKGIWAMGETPTLIKVIGLPYGFMRSLIFILSSFFGGVASLLTTFELGIEPHVGMHALLTGAVAVLVGGIDQFWGWIGGALLLAIFQSIAVWLFASKWIDMITFSIFIFTLIFRPQGLFSPKKRREEL